MDPQELPTRDQFGRLLEDRGVWRQATTLAAAGELTARWLEGASQYQPGTFAPGFDDETRPLPQPSPSLTATGSSPRSPSPASGPDRRRSGSM